ncbi:MAG: thioredoxin family protein [Planctomycetes bacterium]|nr:thioredoxin family protein [Planctomycetota bacterium]
MKTILRSIAVTACALVLVACGEDTTAKGNAGGAVDKGAWLGDMDSAIKEAMATKKPILVDFGAEW